MGFSKPPVILEPRKLPVVVLADVSDSMNLPIEGGAGTRIEALNRGIRELVAACAAQPVDMAQISVTVIAFGNGRADLVIAPTPAVEVADAWTDLAAGGDTPLGQALTVAADLIEGSAISERDWRPILALCSDGAPTDTWEAPLARLESGPRSRKADRFAVAIGAGEHRGVLERFIKPALEAEDTLAKVFDADNAHGMARFFKAVSWASSQRSRSSNPDQLPQSIRSSLTALG